MAPRPPATPSSSGASSSTGGGRAAGSGGLAAWLRTREGKITAGAGAALLVVILALRKGAGEGGEGFLPSAIQPSQDGSLGPLLDQVGGGGGTLAEWITATTDLSGDVRSLTDLLEAQNPLPKTPLTPKPPGATPAPPKPKKPPWGTVTGLARIGVVGKSYNLRQTAARFAPSSHPNAVEATLRRIVQLNPALKGKTTVPGGFPLIVPK